MLSLPLLCVLVHLRTASTFAVNLTPHDALFRAGGRQELRCSVVGCADKATIHWGLLEDKPLDAQISSNQTDSVATFVPVKPEHEGTLLCKVTCGAKSRQSRVVVVVYSFPEAPVVRGHEHVVVGEEVSLTCTVPHLYPPQMVTVEWLQGNNVLQREGPVLHPVQSTYRFTARRAHKPTPRPNPDSNPRADPNPGSDPCADPNPRSDPSPDPNPRSDPSLDPDPNPETNLTCRATLHLAGLPAEDRTRETSVPLRLHYPPEITQISPAARVSPGSSVALVCSVDGQPRPLVTWTFGGPEGAKVAVGRHQCLVLEDITGRQAGVYRCLASNPLGSQTAHVRITVEAPPSNTSISVVPGGEAEEGQKLNVSCQSEVAGPSVMVLRRVSQEKIVELQSSENSSSVFFILETKLQHSGHYQCESSNQYGSELVNTSITVKAAPRNMSVLVYPSTELQEGQNVTISCHSVSYPPPTVILRKLANGIERYSSDGLFLLFSVSANDSGLYQVNMTNELGYQTLTFTISVLGRSSAPPTDMMAVLVSLVSVAMVLAVTAMLLDSLRRSRKKGFYKLTKAPPPSPPPLSS